MTEPTDAELLAEWDRVSHIAEAGQSRLACLRAVLAKWGTPAVAGEPVMWAYQYSDGSWHDASATEHSAGMKPLYPAPQPIQAQAGAVPLTDVRVPLSDEQVDELASPYLLRMFGSIKIFNEVMRRFARTIERAHGITAKEPT